MKFFLPLFLISTSIYSYDFKKLEHYLYVESDPGMVTEASVVWHDGKIVYEKYKKGDEDTLHLLWSMSKSISSLLIGIAQEKKYLSLDDGLIKYFATEIAKMNSDKQKQLKKIKLRHLLHMSSGFDWKELYEADPFRSHVVNMLYSSDIESMGTYVLKTPIKYRPGERFNYSSGDTNVLMEALRRSLPKNLKDSYPWEWFLDPLEMNAIFEQDKVGAFIGSSYAYLRTKDLLKLGKLILNKGKYEDKQVVPKEYIDYAIKISPYLKDNCLNNTELTYGAHIWLNHKCPNSKIPLKDIPDNLVMFLGHGGQSIFILPEQKIIAVRIARDKHKAMNKRRYALKLLGILEEEK